MKRFIALIALFLCSATAWAQNVWTGKITAVKDGDTVEFLLDCGEYKIPFDVRLYGIDAPEKKQAFGQASKQALSDLCFGKTVSMSWRKKDRYGRLLGTLSLAGANLNERMVADGMAWHYADIGTDAEKASDVYKRLAELETAAAAAKKGLWSDLNTANPPVKPWDFRHHHGIPEHHDEHE